MKRSVYSSSIVKIGKEFVFSLNIDNSNLHSTLTSEKKSYMYYDEIFGLKLYEFRQTNEIPSQGSRVVFGEKFCPQLTTDK